MHAAGDDPSAGWTKEGGMNSKRPVATVVLALGCGSVCFFTSVKDDGNAEFYWRPLLGLWYFTTACSFVVPGRSRLARLRDGWWLQLLMPVVLLAVACLLVRVHEPFPLRAAAHVSKDGTRP